MRDTFPGVACRLDLPGSVVCESFILAVDRQPSPEVKRNINHMVRLNTIQSNPNGPRFSRSHLKQETVWSKQYTNYDLADLTLYPEDGQELTAWKEGMDPNQNRQECYLHIFLAKMPLKVIHRLSRNTDDDEIVEEMFFHEECYPNETTGEVPEEDPDEVPEFSTDEVDHALNILSQTVE